MRLKVKIKKEPREHDERVKAGFLFLPKRVGDEWRWLEFARWRQRCALMPYIPPPGVGYSPGQTCLRWISTEWV